MTDKLREALQKIASMEANDRHNSNRNDLVACAAVRIAAEALAAAPQPAPDRDPHFQLSGAKVGSPAQPQTPVDRDALVEVIESARERSTSSYAIADALPARGLRLPGGDETREASDEVKSYLDGVIGVVEANSFESMCLWQTNHESRKWVSSGHGYGSCVGNCAGKPVCISLTTATVDGHKILFIEATSEIVDWALIEAWLKKNLPSAAWTDGRVNRTNAMNFHNVIPRAAIRVVEGGDDAA